MVPFLSRVNEPTEALITTQAGLLDLLSVPSTGLLSDYEDFNRIGKLYSVKLLT